MSIAGLASQLRNAQDAASAGTAAAQAGAAMRSVSGAFSSVASQAKNMAGDAQMRAGLLKKSGEPALPSDGSVCESCGKPFGPLQRRSTCSSCDRYLCSTCLGSSFAATIGLKCLCAAVCPKCKEQSAQVSELEMHIAEMEKGVGATFTLPSSTSRKGGAFSGGPVKKVGVWFSLDRHASELKWATLEQRNSVPVEEGRIKLFELLSVRNTGLAIELVTSTQSAPLVLELGSTLERENWARYLQLAIDVLIPESQRSDWESARNSHRQKEIAERKKENDERKKKLSDGLGMRFTAEAMMNRTAK
mmetsp:Transcript_63915/g.152441  ORF Transcript_63915/g.152441 Transcript_63915/m.152441 type:complete len:304 (-) Transcript_63915:51-962(-)